MSSLFPVFIWFIGGCCQCRLPPKLGMISSNDDARLLPTVVVTSTHSWTDFPGSIDPQHRQGTANAARTNTEGCVFGNISIQFFFCSVAVGRWEKRRIAVTRTVLGNGIGDWCYHTVGHACRHTHPLIWLCFGSRPSWSCCCRWW